MRTRKCDGISPRSATAAPQRECRARGRWRFRMRRESNAHRYHRYKHAVSALHKQTEQERFLLLPLPRLLLRSLHSSALPSGRSRVPCSRIATLRCNQAQQLTVQKRMPQWIQSKRNTHLPTKDNPKHICPPTHRSNIVNESVLLCSETYRAQRRRRADGTSRSAPRRPS